MLLARNIAAIVVAGQRNGGQLSSAAVRPAGPGPGCHPGHNRPAGNARARERGHGAGPDSLCADPHRPAGRSEPAVTSTPALAGPDRAAPTPGAAAPTPG